MTDFQKGIIALVQAALTGKAQILPSEFDLKRVIQFGHKHGVATMLYYGAQNCGVDMSDPAFGEIFSYVCKNIATGERQMYQYRKICDAFDENRINYMPMKGALMKMLYPKAEMRSMSDVDILIQLDQYGAIKPIMEKLGFQEEQESDHELIWKNAATYVELHKWLIPSYNKDYYAYFGTGWSLAKRCDGTHYSMTDEDQMIYLFTHFSKHYRDAGIGIRHIVDLWVFYNSVPSMDKAYLQQELTKLSLNVFFNNIMDTLAVWFEDKPATDVTNLITDVIFNSGVYGTSEAHVLSAAVKRSKKTGSVKNVKANTVWRLLFLPYTEMSRKYPVLKKAPVLLPIFWVYRIVTAVLFRPKAIQRQQGRLREMSEENINDYQNALHYVGLDFNFKE